MRLTRQQTRNIAILLVIAAAAIQRCSSSKSSAPTAQLPASCSVSRLADGDSLTCAGGFEIRLIGIDAPELSQQPFGRQSRDALYDIIGGAELRLEYDVERRDRFDRLLAYVWIGPTFVNERMVRDGWAVAFRVPPNKRSASLLDDAEDDARAENAGHWGSGGFECLPVNHRAGSC